MVDKRPLAGRLKGTHLTLLADQAVSSGTNFVSLALIAGASTPPEFGAIALGALVFTTALALTRAGLGEVTLLGDLDRNETQQAAWVIGFVAALLLAGTALAFDGIVRVSLLITAAALPGGLAQDMSRWIEIRAGSPRRALLSDATWLASLIAIAGLLHAVDAATGPRLYAAWALSIYLSLWAFQRLAGAWRSAGQGLSALHRVRSTAIESTGQAGITNFSNLLLFALLGLIASLDVVGAVRGAWLLFGPTHVVTAAVSVLAVSSISRQTTEAAKRRIAMVATAVITGGVAVWGAIVLALPERLGQRLLGTTWESVAGLRVESLALFAAVGLGSGAAFLLRATRQHRRMSLTYLMVMPLTLGLPLIASSGRGASGFLVGSAASTMIVSLAMISLAARPIKETDAP